MAQRQEQEAKRDHEVRHQERALGHNLAKQRLGAEHADPAQRNKKRAPAFGRAALPQCEDRNNRKGDQSDQTGERVHIRASEALRSADTPDTVKLRYP